MPATAVDCESVALSIPTIDRWVNRYTKHGIAGLNERSRARTQIHKPEPLDVQIGIVVVNEPHATTLRQRQTAAIRDILKWLQDHPDDPGADHKDD